ncbi:MAG: PEP-CTERM sorting domain-containing protein [Planctomycetota bacterium]
MKKSILLVSLVFLACLVMGFPAQASPIVIEDDYWGGEPSVNKTPNEDFFHGAAYDIQRMIVNYTVSTGSLVVDVVSNYFRNIGLNNTEMGDLFISSDGWNPYGAAPYPEDSDHAHVGEDWEYALMLDNHLSSAGALSLLQIDDKHIATTQELYRGTQNELYRKFQEAQVKNAPDPVLALGTWVVNDNVLHMEIPTGAIFAGVPELGLHWTQSLGYDVIEGRAGLSAVPEPTSWILLTLGVLGLYGYGIKKKRYA